MKNNVLLKVWNTRYQRYLPILGLFFAYSLFSLSADAKREIHESDFQVVTQVKKLKGQVLDETGEPMIGVSVLVKGTTVGTVTDLEGNYFLEIPRGKNILEISYLGYKTQDVTIGKENQLNIKMVPDTQALDEVVVIGYGTVKKRDLTGAVASVKEDVILATPTTSVAAALQGRIAGLDINGSDMRIRGNRSINGSNDPLVIVDGVQGGSWGDIPPADIKSIEVLKDASSTAIYGSQGANGVIIITTKKPELGKMSVSYNGYFGVSKLGEHPDYRWGQSYYDSRKQAAVNAGQWASETDDESLFGSLEEYNAYKNGEWTNYEDLLKHDKFNYNHTVTFSGGSEKTSARFSLGMSGNNDYLKDSDNKKYILRANIDHKLTSWLSAGMNLQLAYSNTNASPYTKSSTTGISLGSAYNEEGELVTYPVGTTGYVNPLIDGIGEGKYSSNSYGTNLVANIYVDITPFKGFSYRTIVNSKLTNSTSGSYMDKGHSTELTSTQRSTATESKSNNRYIEWNNIVTYKFTLDKVHNFGITGITAYTRSITDKMSTTNYNQLVASNLWWNIGSGDTPTPSSSYTQIQTSSYAARFNYDYQGRYLLTASIRWDGASVLAEGNKWASFPSVALGWRISDEPFMNRTKGWIDDLKLRASYGVTGNSGISAYGTQSGVVLSTTGLGFQDATVSHYAFSNTIGNTDTKWELSHTYDIGLDASLFSGRVNLAFDYYDTKTTDILLLRTLPTSSGNDGQFALYQNIGETRNRGYEISLNTVNMLSKYFTWNSTLTFSRNKEKITKLITGDELQIDNTKESSTLMVGHPIKAYKTFIYDGIYRSADAALAASTFKDVDKTQPFAIGDIHVKDLDGDGIISEDKDICYIGSPTPKWFASLNNTFNYKGFDLNVYCYMRWGQYRDNPAASFDPSSGGGYTSLNYFQPITNEGGTLPMLYAGRKSSDYRGYQSLWYCDGSFFKIKTLTLGYTLPQSLTRKVRMDKVRIYVTASNPCWIAKSDWLKHYDPEGTNREYVVGLNVNF